MYQNKQKTEGYKVVLLLSLKKRLKIYNSQIKSKKKMLLFQIITASLNIL